VKKFLYCCLFLFLNVTAYFILDYFKIHKAYYFSVGATWMSAFIIFYPKINKKENV